MQLNQPIPPNYSGGDNQFDFILNGNQKVKKSRLPSGNSRKQRVLLVVGGGLAILTLFGIILTLILSSGGGDKQAILGIAQTQNEIIRISSDGTGKARSAVTQGFAQTVSITTTSAQKQTTDLLSKQGVKVKEKQLIIKKNTKTDAALTSAEQAGRYDEELLAVLKKALANYKAELSQTFTKATSNSQKQLLQQLYKQVQAVIQNQPTS